MYVEAQQALVCERHVHADRYDTPPEQDTDDYAHSIVIVSNLKPTVVN